MGRGDAGRGGALRRGDAGRAGAVGRSKAKARRSYPPMPPYRILTRAIVAFGCVCFFGTVLGAHPVANKYFILKSVWGDVPFQATKTVCFHMRNASVRFCSVPNCPVLSPELIHPILSSDTQAHQHGHRHTHTHTLTHTHTHTTRSLAQHITSQHNTVASGSSLRLGAEACAGRHAGSNSPVRKCCAPRC